MYRTRISTSLAAPSAQAWALQMQTLLREGKRAVMILVTTDKGLCGAINVNNIRAATRYMTEHHAAGQRYVTIGRKGRDFLLRYRRK